MNSEHEQFKSNSANRRSKVNDYDRLARLPYAKFAFVGTGTERYFPIKKVPNDSNLFSNLLNENYKSIEEYSQPLSTTKRAENLIDSIFRYASETKVSEAALFFSGGRDSTLIGKILVDSGVSVHAYHVSRYLIRGHEKKKNLQSLENLASKVGFADLNIVDGGLDLESTDVVFNSRATGTPLYAGLAKLISETDVLSRESLWFGQGADTLSCTVSTQRNAYETLVKRSQKKNMGMDHSIGVENSLLLFSELFSNQFRRKNRIIAAPLASHVAKEFLKSVPKVLNFSKRAQLIIAGMHLTHGLTDSEPFYRLADLANKKVFNPFHDQSTEDIFLSFIECEQDRINWSKNEKVLIEEALNALQIDSSRLTSKGFYVETPHTKFHNHRDVFAWRKKSFENCN